MNMSMVITRQPVTIAELVAALRVQQGRKDALIPTGSDDACRSARAAQGARAVLVVGAHPGAGTSVVALALAEVLGMTDPTSGVDGVRLVDATGDGASGLAGAAQREIGGRDDRWRIGRRGAIDIWWPAAPRISMRELPEIILSGTGPLVVDAGWSDRQGIGAERFGALFAASRVMVVCRASVPGVRRVELALEGLPGRPVVAAVGARRWPAAVVASWGPRLAQAVSEDRAVLIPSVRRVEVNGIDSEALPRSITGAATRVAGLLWPATLASSQTSRIGRVHR